MTLLLYQRKDLQIEDTPICTQMAMAPICRVKECMPWFCIVFIKLTKKQLL